jgi:HSP20 family protein
MLEHPQMRSLPADRLRVSAIPCQQNDKEWKVAVDLPGLKKDDIRIELDHGMLTIEAERSEDKQQKGETFTRRSAPFGVAST